MAREELKILNGKGRHVIWDVNEQESMYTHHCCIKLSHSSGNFMVVSAQPNSQALFPAF